MLEQPAGRPGEAQRLAAARSGDRDAFGELVQAHLPEIHVHCYRMLGSFHDAEDATQETLLRACRSFSTFEGRAPLRAWLYRIATTTCLKLLEARNRQPSEPAGTGADLAHLQPYPDRLLDQLDPSSADPAAVVMTRESVRLAFVTAVQQLPARQRAVLILRDVLAWSAAEVADLLEISVPAINSALQRARRSIGTSSRPPGIDARRSDSLGNAERELVERFVEAWERNDIAGLVALLRADAVLTMPPAALSFVGPEAIGRFFAMVPGGGRLDRIRLSITRANGDPALAAYVLDASGSWRAYGIMVLSVVGDAVASITGFQDSSLFEAFGLPQVLDN